MDNLHVISIHPRPLVTSGGHLF